MDLGKELNDVETAMIAELTVATRIVMQKRGIKQNSNLIKSIDWEKSQNGFVLLANDYFNYASEGRRPNARKVPIKDLLDWMGRYGIRPKAGQTKNQLAFQIQSGIYKNGIKKKNYANPVVEITSEMIAENTSEALSEIIATAIAETINN